MKKNKFCLILTCIFILIMFSSSVIANENTDQNNNTKISLNNNSHAESINKVYVIDDSAYNQMDNPTIQKTINNAKSGDTIQITGKSYIHCHFVINKNLTIISDVETSMSPCPSNIQGSKGIGIFYITPEASGTIISGFKLINNEAQSGSIDSYCIYVNGADDVIIKNCSIEKTTEGPGIFIHNTKNTLIINSTVKNSQKGIYLENCEYTSIKYNIIDSNKIAGIYIGDKTCNLNIYKNIIHANDYYGIYLGSATNTIIYSNEITENRDNPVFQRNSKGTGIFVDCNVTNLQILGNFIKENGKYGVYDSYKFTNMKNQYVQIINQNYFVHHSERAVFHANPNNETTVVYVGSNYYSQELFCGGTYYEPGVLIGNHDRDIVMTKITEIKKGVYSISFIRKDTKEVAADLNSIDITFFLNKKNIMPIPESGDIYKVIRITNGTAIVNFCNETYLPNGNTITAVGP